MGLRKTDGMATMTVDEWKRKQARKVLRQRIVIWAAYGILAFFAVAVTIYFLFRMRIIRWLCHEQTCI